MLNIDLYIKIEVALLFMAFIIVLLVVASLNEGFESLNIIKYFNDEIKWLIFQ